MGRKTKALLLLGLIGGGLALAAQSVRVRRAVIEQLDPNYTVQAASNDLKPTFDGKDAGRTHLHLQLTPVAAGLSQPTDIQFVPGDPTLMLLLEKKGTVRWFDLSTQKDGNLLKIAVRTASEEGLLGLAFHPNFQENGLFYLNYVTQRSDNADITRIAEWGVEPGADLRSAKATERRVLLEVEQPYQNHDAGQLAFGPDGLLYIGLGDGGYRADPHHNGQDLGTLLGSMLRIGVDASGELPYTIPSDNPFVSRAGARPEIWAYGLRNPWRYSFDPKGRLIVADVGQDTFEEVDIVPAGGNMGWNLREARHCFQPANDCPTEGLTEPIYEYGRAEGQSITGGYVYTGQRIPAFQGHYVFADFVSGRLWALALPDEPGGPLVEAMSAGRFGILPSTFGRDASGELYVADFQSGQIYRIDPGE